MRRAEKTVAAIVVTYHTGPRLMECLYALGAQDGIAEIIIIDNGNPASMQDRIKTFLGRRAETGEASGQRVHYMQTPENLGFARAVNLGVKESHASHLLVINPDCVMRPDALPFLLDASEDLPSPWMVGGRIYDLTGTAQRGPRRQELTLRRALSKLIGGAGINLPLEPQPHDPVPVNVTSGAFFLMDRKGFDQIGGFDENYFLHVEDIDLCKRVNMAGGKILYQPKAGALHYGATSNVSSLFVEKHKATGFARYFRKFAKGPFHRLAAELCIPLIYAGLMMRAFLFGRPKPRQ